MSCVIGNDMISNSSFMMYVTCFVYNLLSEPTNVQNINRNVYFVTYSNMFRRASKHVGILYEIDNIFKLLKPTGHVMRQQFNIQQLYALPKLYLCILYLSENKERLVPLTA